MLIPYSLVERYLNDIKAKKINNNVKSFSGWQEQLQGLTSQLKIAVIYRSMRRNGFTQKWKSAIHFTNFFFERHSLPMQWSRQANVISSKNNYYMASFYSYFATNVKLYICKFCKKRNTNTTLPWSSISRIWNNTEIYRQLSLPGKYKREIFLLRPSLTNVSSNTHSQIVSASNL